MRRLCLTNPVFKFSLGALSLILSFALTANAAQRQVLYAATGTFGVGGVLYTLDAATGAVLTTVGPLDDADGNNYGMTGLCYDPFNGIFYGASGNPSPTNPNFLVIVDPVTAEVTPIGPFGAVMTDIALDPKTGSMYGVSGYNQKFYTIDLETGLASQTGSTGIGFQNGGGLAANSKGEFYGVSYFSTYGYDKTTGARRWLVQRFFRTW